MATGVVVGLGFLIHICICAQEKVDFTARSMDARRMASLKLGLGGAALATAIGCMIQGLVTSCSRGSWVAGFCGFAFLFRSWARGKSGGHEIGGAVMSNGNQRGYFFSAPHFTHLTTWLGQNWAAVFVGALSVIVLAFWSFQATECRIMHRGPSVFNPNDFAWRNRVVTWNGAIQMMGEKPWLGFGWSRGEQVYDRLYRPPSLPESGAIELNDYMTLGTTLGVPALLSFIVYVGLALRSPRSSVSSLQPRSGPAAGDDQSPIADRRLGNAELAFQRAREEWLRATCRAGAIVLLVGFWFDGGLFKLPTATVFWILIELGREDGKQMLKAEC